MVKIDLKDAYFSIPIDLAHRPFLHFQHRAVTYQFKCLPFGLSSAPRIFTKISRPVAAWLRQLGYRMINYINDNLLMVNTREEAKLMGELAVTLLECLGFTVNYAKSLLEPVQSIQFLGFNLDSTKLEMTIPEPKMEKMRGKARDLLSQEGTSGRELASFIGTASLMALAIPPAPLFYRALQAAKNSVIVAPQGLDTLLDLSTSQKEELQWWTDQAHLWNGCLIKPPRQVLKIETDASLMGWGVCCQGRRAGGPWSLEEAQHHINYLELLAIFLATQTFAGESNDLTILVQTDNRSAMTYVNKRGGTRILPS